MWFGMGYEMTPFRTLFTRAPEDHYVHESKRSSSLYYLRDVPTCATGSASRSGKVSLGTANRALAIKKARALAFDHDQIIADARKPDPILSLSKDQRKLINEAGGMDGYLAWLERRARDADHNGSQAEFWRDFAEDDGPADEIPDPDWAAARATGLAAEQKAIHSQIARDVPMLKALEITEAKLRETRRHMLADAIGTDLIDPNTARRRL
jgi:hypothetical protein